MKTVSQNPMIANNPTRNGVDFRAVQLSMVHIRFTEGTLMKYRYRDGLSPFVSETRQIPKWCYYGRVRLT